MMKRVLTWTAAAVATALLSMPASADWFHDSIAAAKAQRGEASETARPRREARSEAAAEKPRRAAKPRVAQSSDNDDDGSRPQRRQASAPRQTESLSGGETGVASYYWQPQRVASGGWFNPDAWTAAHKTLPFGTRVRVTHLGNGNTVEVTINDRGPYIAGRIIDLSRRAAQAIGMTGSGIARVRVDIIGRG